MIKEVKCPFCGYIVETDGERIVCERCKRVVIIPKEEEMNEI